MDNQKGFTLIELMCIFAVLGILLLIATPEIISIKDKWILDSTAKQIVEDIRWTQHLAMTEAAYYYFDLNITERTYRIQNRADHETIKNIEIHPDITHISSTLKKEGTYYRLSYTPTGIPAQTGSIYLTSRGDKELKITVAVGTGRVAIAP